MTAAVEVVEMVAGVGGFVEQVRVVEMGEVTGVVFQKMKTVARVHWLLCII